MTCLVRMSAKAKTYNIASGTNVDVLVRGQVVIVKIRPDYVLEIVNERLALIEEQMILNVNCHKNMVTSNRRRRALVKAPVFTSHFTRTKPC